MGNAALGIVGNLNVDLLLGPVKQLPAWDTEVLAERMELRCAGTAGYLALAARSLGLPVVVLSTIGPDLYGDYLRGELHRHDIPDAGVAALAGESTPITVVTVGEGGPRAMVTVQGAHTRMDLDYYQRYRHLLADCAEIFLCGSYLLPHLDCRAALTIAREMRAEGKQIYFDPSWDPTNWSDPVREATLALLPMVDLFLPNSEEIRGLTGLTDWREAAAQIARLGPEVVVKRGANGSAALVNGDWFEAPAHPVACYDTTGAGDVFDAAYVWARRKGWAPTDRLRWANTVSALVVKQDPRTHYPSVEEAMEALRRGDATTAS